MSSPLDDNNSCNWPLPTSASWPCSGFSLLINVNLILPHPYNTYNDFVFSVTPDLLSRAVVLSPNLPAAFSSLFLATFHYLVLSIPTCVKLSANSGTQKLCPYVFYSLVLMLPVTSSMKAFWKTSSKINFLWFCLLFYFQSKILFNNLESWLCLFGFCMLHPFGCEL